MRLDVIRAVGVSNAWRRIRDDRNRRRLGTSARDGIYRDIWRDAAHEVGAELAELSNGFLEIKRGSQATRVWQQFNELDNAVALRLALDKGLVYRLLQSADLPVPEHFEFGVAALPDAASFLAAHGRPCVVKPASGTDSGGGVTSGVITKAQLARAAVRAARSASRLLIEHQASGDVYRLLLLDGELLDVIRRSPPSVTGDGTSTIAQLIADENRRRVAGKGHEGLSLLRIDLDSVFALQAADLTLRSVLPKGVTVPVKTVTNQNRPQDNQTVRTPVSAELLAEVAAAAEAVGLRLAGVDVIASDVGTSLGASGGVIIEVNGTPGLHHHYHVAERAQSSRVAIPVLRELLR